MYVVATAMLKTRVRMDFHMVERDVLVVVVVMVDLHMVEIVAWVTIDDQQELQS